MVRVKELNSMPSVTIPYEYLATGGVRSRRELPVLFGTASGLPDSLDALVLTSDLQGVEPRGVTAGRPRPLGAVIASWLGAIAPDDVAPSRRRMAAVLAGDFHVDSSLKARGGCGDVRPIWEAFGLWMKWVVGVPGNHDRFESRDRGQASFTGGGTYYLVDGDTVDVDSIRIAGLGGIIGSSAKPYRRPESTYLDMLKSLCSERPDIVVLHQSPCERRFGYAGSQPIRDCLESTAPVLVVSGHSEWPAAIGYLTNGGQVLNVAGRVVVLRR